MCEGTERRRKWVHQFSRNSDGTAVTLQELKSALDTAEKDKNVGVIVLSGSGDRAFCAGGDMNWESSEEFQDLIQIVAR